ncbi:DUF1097 domain-containing protein [Arthrobacter sp. 35W]|uniref:DUF1097 domain-containing protein n=1 Tax=Arthrobacter sp. 35W TaxID=1132441 RepID=UPI00068919A2|nr:DUF1097 domain-containing protein [Arthrobacter sp. 35W]
MPIEASATLLAASTIFIGGASLNLPTWGIFLGWAATMLAGGPSRSTIAALGRTLVVGGLFALATLWLEGMLGSGLGLPVWAAALVSILVMNPGMLLLGRWAPLSLIPGMFIGFSTVLATHLGHFGPVPGSILSVFVCGLAMNLLGIGFAAVAMALSGGRRQRRSPTETQSPGAAADLQPAAGG